MISSQHNYWDILPKEIFLKNGDASEKITSEAGEASKNVDLKMIISPESLKQTTSYKVTLLQIVHLSNSLFLLIYQTLCAVLLTAWTVWHSGSWVLINKNPRQITALDVLLTDKCRALSNKTETKEETVDWHFPIPLPSCFLCLKYNVQMVASLSGGGSTPTTNSD